MIQTEPFNPITNAIFEAAKNRDEDPRYYLGMSEIGDPCSRRLWFKFRGAKSIPFDGKLILIFEMGNYVETSIIYHLEKAGYNITNKQDEYSDFNGQLSGHNDGVIIVDSNGGEPHQLEIKSCNDKAFKRFKKYGVEKTHPKYYGQCQAYMGYSELGMTLFIAQNKDNCKLHTELIEFNQYDFTMLKNKAESIITSEYPPDYGYSRESMDCEWCNYRLPCRYMKAGIMADEICYSCGHCKHGIQPFCKYHKVDITKAGVKCKQWESMFTKKWIETEGKRYSIK